MGDFDSDFVLKKENSFKKESKSPSSDSGLSCDTNSNSDVFDSNKDSLKIMADGVNFVNDPQLSECTFQYSIKQKLLENNEEYERKRKEEEEYIRELHEQRYKRLLHLLNRSKFFSNYLIEKINLPTKTISKPKIKRHKTVESSDENKNLNENVPPSKKAKFAKDIRAKYDIREYISPRVKEKASNSTKLSNTKTKMNLSQEDIQAELSADSETEDKVVIDNIETPKYFEGSLRDYQKEGLQWLKVLYENGMNGILADEMGLGKTIQCIALFCHLISKRQSGPYLIIAPLSTIPNWQIEFEKFAPSLPVAVLHGSQPERANIIKSIKKKHLIGTEFKTQPIVITTYEVTLNDNTYLKSENWRYIVVDEGHRLKNHQSQLSRVLRTFTSMNRLILTGTPLQNNLSELWSLLNFLLPEIFDDLALFESWFDAKEFQGDEGTKKLLKQEEEKNVLQLLREILKPFMLRREKQDVCLDIPPKKEILLYVPMTQLQYDLYKAILNRDIKILSKISDDSLVLYNEDGTRPKRKCTLRERNLYGDNTCHIPNYNLSHDEFKESDDSLQERLEDMKSAHQKLLTRWKEYTDVNERNRDYLVRITFRMTTVMYKKVINHPYLIHCPLDDAGLIKIDEDLIKCSGKMLVLNALLAKLKQKNHKVLLFSTMCMILDMIEEYLIMRNYTYVRLDGRRRIEDRKKNIEQFNTDENIFLFLISTRAGGVGLNLTAADTVILFDSDWNPQADIQAMARCHRIGQTKPVVIYRLCTKGTIDETIIKRGETKRLLEKMVISKDVDIKGSLDLKILKQLKQQIEAEECNIITPDNAEHMLNKILDRSVMTK